MSYTGAHIFEAGGLEGAFVDKDLRGTNSNIEGIGVFDHRRRGRCALDTSRHSATTGARHALEAGGEITPYASAASEHMWRRPGCARQIADTRKYQEAFHVQRNTPRYKDQSRRQMDACAGCCSKSAAGPGARMKSRRGKGEGNRQAL